MRKLLAVLAAVVVSVGLWAGPAAAVSIDVGNGLQLGPTGCSIIRAWGNHIPADSMTALGSEVASRPTIEDYRAFVVTVRPDAYHAWVRFHYYDGNDNVFASSTSWYHVGAGGIIDMPNVGAHYARADFSQGGSEATRTETCWFGHTH